MFNHFRLFVHIFHFICHFVHCWPYFPVAAKNAQKWSKLVHNDSATGGDKGPASLFGGGGSHIHPCKNPRIRHIRISRSLIMGGGTKRPPNIWPIVRNLAMFDHFEVSSNALEAG